MGALIELGLSKIVYVIVVIALAAAGYSLVSGAKTDNFASQVRTTLGNVQERFQTSGFSTLTQAIAVDGKLFAEGLHKSGSGATAVVTSRWGNVSLSKHTIDAADDSFYMQADTIPTEECNELVEKGLSPYIYVGGTAAANLVRSPIVNGGRIDIAKTTNLCNAAATTSLYFATK